MVLSYGLTMEFTEIIWKATVKKAFPVKTEYLKFMGRYSTLVGCSSFMMMFVGSWIIKNLGSHDLILFSFPRFPKILVIYAPFPPPTVWPISRLEGWSAADAGDDGRTCFALFRVHHFRWKRYA